MQTQETETIGEASFCAALTMLVRSKEWPDLTSRQLAVLMICYLDSEAQTVRGLAARLNVSKPAITRAIDRLEEFTFARRKQDPNDRRSILVQRTANGMALLRDIRASLNGAPKSTLKKRLRPAA
jgi:DNA-binding MarR family transcriptional regulator